MGDEYLESGSEYQDSDESDDELDDQTAVSLEEEDDSLHVDNTLVFSSSVDYERRFAIVLRQVIMVLMNFAQSDIRDDPKTQALHPGYWYLLRDFNIDTWFEKFLKAVPDQVQALFDQEIWSFEDLLALPSSIGIKRQGVYGIFF